jgi:hypothetical protein
MLSEKFFRDHDLALAVQIIGRFEVQWFAVRLTHGRAQAGSRFQEAKQDFSDSIALKNTLNTD